MNKLLSQSPNPRPNIVVPDEPTWSPEQIRYLVNEYNAMVDEIEKLSAVLVSAGIDPRHALEPTPLAEPTELHPAVADVLRYFEYEHLPPHLQTVAQPLHGLAHRMANRLNGPQLTNGLNRLLEAKDCFVRAALK